MSSRSRGGAFVATFLWIAAFIGARFWLESGGLEDGARIAVALLPLPFFAWMLWGIIRNIGTFDELERKIHLEALAVAFPLTILLIMTLGLLQLAVPPDPEDWSFRHIWPYPFGFYFTGLAWARKRYS